MLRFYHDMDWLKKYALLTALFTLVIALLIGNRLGFVFAGGQGFQHPLVLSGEGGSYSRGSVIETKAGERQLISNETLFLWLDENTTLQVHILTDELVELVLTRGRMVAIEQTPSERITTIIAGDTTTTLVMDQPISIVNYDFLGKVDVSPIEKILKEDGAAKDFYAWYYSSKD